MSEEKKSFYAIIPANVRYDKNLKANEKLMYGELTALSNEKGYCWASNGYFSELYGVSKQSISVWINSLQKNGYITIELLRKGKEIVKRKITINTVGVSSKVDEPINKTLTTYQDNLKENNTYNNTVKNTMGKFEKFWKAYPKKKAKGQAEKAWKKIDPSLFTEILDALENHKMTKDWIKEEGKYIPYPASWLNAKRWEDDVEVNENNVATLNDRIMQDLQRW